MNADKIEGIIFEVLQEIDDKRVDKDGPEAITLSDDLGIILSGNGAELDSLELIFLLDGVEECLEAEGYDISLTDDAATAAVPWETGETLLAYIADRLA